MNRLYAAAKVITGTPSAGMPTPCDDKLAIILSAARATAYDAPAHNPRIKKAYSVSLPV